MPELRGQRTEGERARAAMLYGQGVPLLEICEEVQIDRRTLWEWRTRDPEFQRIANEVIEQGIAESASRLRALAPRVVEAFERGLASTHRQQAMKVKGLSVSEDGDELTIEHVQLIDLQDNSLAVQTATKVSERIPELMPRKGVEVDLDVSEQVSAIIRGLDADPGEGQARSSLPPPPGPPAGSPDAPEDPDETA